MLIAWKCTSDEVRFWPALLRNISCEKGLLQISSLSSSPPEPDSTRCWIYLPVPQRYVMTEMEREVGICTIIRLSAPSDLRSDWAGSVSECARD